MLEKEKKKEVNYLRSSDRHMRGSARPHLINALLDANANRKLGKGEAKFTTIQVDYVIIVN